MGYQLGIDLGTTYTAAAVCRSAGPALGRAGGRHPRHAAAPPSPPCCSWPRTASVVVGEAAERRALTDPDRVVREFKRRIGDPTPIVVGGRSWAPEELSARLVRWVVDRVAEREGGPAAQIAVTHPASWGQPQEGPAHRRARGAGPARSRCSPSRRPPRCTTPRTSGSRPAPPSRSTTWAAARSTPPSCARPTAPRPRFGAAGFGLLGRPEGLDRLGGVDFDEVVFEHVRDGPARRVQRPRRHRHGACCRPSRACGGSARRPRRRCRPTRTCRSRCCCPRAAVRCACTAASSSR